ncbi:hypothetical protein J7J81_01125 [bacterium]|nr:hypothetical protein [bacterium]
MQPINFKKNIKIVLGFLIAANLSFASLGLAIHLSHSSKTFAQSPVDEFSAGSAGTCFDSIPIGEATEKTVDFLNVIYTNLQTIHQIIPQQIQTAEGVLGEVGSPTSSCSCGPDKVTPFCVNSPITIALTATCFGIPASFNSQIPFCVNSALSFDLTALLKYLFPQFFPESVPSPSVSLLANTYSGRPCPNIDFDYEILKDTYNRLASSVENIENVVGLSRKKTENVTDDIMNLGESTTTKITLLEFIKRKLDISRKKFDACFQTVPQQRAALKGEITLKQAMKCTDSFPGGDYSFTEEKIKECKDKMVCLNYPTETDDEKCGDISCSGTYEKTGIESPTATQVCWTKKPLTENRCQKMGQCKEPNCSDCDSQPTSTQVYSCGTCCYIKEENCTGTNMGTCTVYGKDKYIGYMYYTTGTESITDTNWWKAGKIYCTGDSCGAEGTYTKNPSEDATIATCGVCQYADPNDSPTPDRSKAVCKNYPDNTSCGICKVCKSGECSPIKRRYYQVVASDSPHENCKETPVPEEGDVRYLGCSDCPQKTFTYTTGKDTSSEMNYTIFYGCYNGRCLNKEDIGYYWSNRGTDRGYSCNTLCQNHNFEGALYGIIVDNVFRVKRYIGPDNEMPDGSSVYAYRTIKGQKEYALNCGWTNWFTFCVCVKEPD